MTNSNAHRNSSVSVIDRDRLSSISDGEREFEIELLDAYIEDARDCLADIEVALAADNWSDVAAVAHQLKGASGNVGALCMLELCVQLEQEARNCCRNGTVELLHQALEAVTEVAKQW
ncbi:MAG: Hpt domain-containing protein [Cyanobacteria bacterium P01_A01_bin.3]